MKRIIIIIVCIVLIGVITYFLLFKKPEGTLVVGGNEDFEDVGAKFIPSPSLSIDGLFGQRTLTALKRFAGVESVSYADAISFYERYAKHGLISIVENYDRQYDKIVMGIYNKTTDTFIKDPLKLIDIKNFPLKLNSKGIEVVLLQYILKRA